MITLFWLIAAGVFLIWGEFHRERDQEVFIGTVSRQWLFPENTWRSNNVDLMLAHRLRRWANIKSTLEQLAESLISEVSSTEGPRDNQILSGHYLGGGTCWPGNCHHVIPGGSIQLWNSVGPVLSEMPGDGFHGRVTAPLNQRTQGISTQNKLVGPIYRQLWHCQSDTHNHHDHATGKWLCRILMSFCLPLVYIYIWLLFSH